jgi:peroxiredoxin Q/BCP
MTLSPGDPAPAFSLAADDGSTISLDDFAGTSVVMYFYPAAFTPGCTTESCDFRDNHQALAAQGYQIIGVSPDPVEKLARFRTDYELPFHLLSDPDHAVAAAYGAWGVKKNYGKEYEGLIRSTFVIGPDGLIADARRNVKATGHVARIVSDLG